MSYIGIIITYVFVQNFILVQFMGLCPFIGVSKNSESAIGMGMAVTFVTAVASVVCYMVYYFLLVPFGIEYLKTVAFILVIAALVQLVEMVVRKMSPALYKALGIFLPLITTNCAVLGAAEINCKQGSGFFESVFFSFSAALGFGFALLVFSGLREKLAHANPPACFRGVAVALVAGGLLSLAFMGFSGLVKLPY